MLLESTRRSSFDTKAAMRAAISDLDFKILALQAERAALLGRLAESSDPSCHISKLPPEILCRIFYIATLPRAEPFGSTPLLDILLVCSEWANLATTTPNLWSQFLLSEQVPIPSIEARLKRSLTGPLDIDFRMSSDASGMESLERLDTRMKLICQYMNRWRSFMLSVSDWQHASIAIHNCVVPAPLLERLAIHLHCHDSSQVPEPLGPHIFHSTLPRLRRLSLNSLQFNWNNPIYSSQLRVLRLTRFPIHHSPSHLELLDLLARCTQLRELSISHLETPDGELGGEVVPGFLPPPPTRIIVLPHLTRLRMEECDITRAKMLLYHTRLPLLESLELCAMQPFSYALQALDSGASAVKTLRLERGFLGYLEEAGIVETMRTHPSLTSLELITCSGSVGGLLEMLSLEATNGQVTSLDLEGTHPIPFDLLLDFAIIKYKNPFAKRLRFLSVRQCAREIFMEEEVERLKRYVDTVVSDYDAYGG